MALHTGEAEERDGLRASAGSGPLRSAATISDFVDLVVILGAPRQVLWLTCGNTSNASLK